MNNIPVSTTQQTNNSIINTKPFVLNASNGISVPSESIILQEGQIISAEVIDHNRNEVTIQLDNNQIFTALLSEDSQVKIGETFNFSVLKNLNNQLMLQALHTNMSPISSTILEALEAANLPRSQRNQEIVRELLNQQMSIDKHSIQNILRHSLTYKEASISSLVLMSKHNLPITEDNVAQFDHYRNYEHRIVKEIKLITQSLPNAMEIMHNKGNSNQVFSLFNNMMSHLSFNESLDTGTKDSSYFTLTQQEIKDIASHLDAYPTEKEMFYKALEQKGTPSEFLSHLKTKGIRHPVIDNIAEQYHSYQIEHRQIGAFLSPNERNQLFKEILASFPHINLPQSIQDGSITTHEFFSLIDSQLMQSGGNNNPQLLSSNQYQSIVKEHLFDEWTLSPKDLTQEDSVSNLYKKINKNLSEISDFISQLKFIQHTEQENQPLKQLEQGTTNMKQNIEFMKSLNEILTFVQLPLQLRDKTVHSDLYVYTNKKELKKNKEQVSALLHLDLDYLGSLDIHINLNYKQITSKFYLENEELQEFISRHIVELATTLERKGYHFHSEVHHSKNSSSVIDNLLATDSSNSLIQKYSFDIRA